MSGTIAQYAKLIDPAVRKHAIDSYQEAEPKLEEIFKVETQTDYNEQEQNYTGIGELVSIAEGETYPQDAPIQSYGTTYTSVKYGKMITLTYETKLWEKDTMVSKAAKMGGKAAARKVEDLGSSVFNNAFNTANTSYGDSKPLCSVDHTRADGGTAQSNASATGITLTESNLETAQIAAIEVLDDRGQAIEIAPDTLLVPPALRKEGIIILKSPGRSNTSDNDINVYNGSIQKYKGATLPNLICWNYLGAYLGGSDTAWFLVDSLNHQVKFKWGEKVKVEMDESFENDIMQWKVRFFASTGWSDFRGVWGSKGDGQAYAS